MREGLYPTALPYVPGTEVAGTVVAVGGGVRDLRPGDRVVTQNAKGAYAERTVADAERVVRIPDGVDTRVAAAVWLQGLTAHYLTHSTFPLGRGHTCLVHAAAGGVGLLLCQMARLRGAAVIGTASTPDKRRRVLETGALAAVDYTTQDFAAEARRLTNGAGVDVVYDSVGATTFGRSLDALRPRGLLALFGQSSGPVPPFDPQLLNRKGSLFLTRPTLGAYVATRDELESRARDLFAWIASGALHVEIGAEYPLAQAAEAHRALEGRRTVGKVLLVPGH